LLVPDVCFPGSFFAGVENNVQWPQLYPDHAWVSCIEDNYSSNGCTAAVMYMIIACDRDALFCHVIGSAGRMR
jgi:hypothetical protein